MVTIEEQIEAVEEELHRTQYNKHTEHHVGSLYGKIAKLKEKLEKQPSTRTKGSVFAVKKSGDATAVLVGFPSVGKSTLLNALTNASSKVAAYDFTTLTPIPGMMKYRDAYIQIIDLPGIISEASKGKGRGKEVLNVVRAADLVILIIEPRKPEQLDIIRRELYKVGVRLDAKPPKIIIKKSVKGGIKVQSTVELSHLNGEVIASIMAGYGLINADVIIREDASIEEFVDALLANRHYVPSMLVFNKVDELSRDELLRIKKEYPSAVFVSAEKKEGLEELREAVFEATRIMRVYLKPHGKMPDMQHPIIMHKGDNIYDVCLKLHKHFAEYFKYALIWGKSAKFAGQKVGFNHTLLDGDIVSIIT